MFQQITNKQKIQTLALIWLGWFVGNLCANALFLLGTDFDLIFYPFGTIVYFITVTITGILIPIHYCKKWQISINIFPEKVTKKFILISLLLLLTMVTLGVFAAGDYLTFQEFLQHDLLWKISPLIQLIPTMIAYTLLWYTLFVNTIKSCFKNKRTGIILSSLITSFIYAIYHFASINEITTMNAMLEEILITFSISLVFCAYAFIIDNFLVSLIVNLVLNYFVFVGVSSFHTGPVDWAFSYLIVLIFVLIYILWWRDQSIQSKEKSF